MRLDGSDWNLLDWTTSMQESKELDGDDLQVGMQGRTVEGVSVEQLSLVPRLVLVSAALIDTSRDDPDQT